MDASFYEAQLQHITASVNSADATLDAILDREPSAARRPWSTSVWIDVFAHRTSLEEIRVGRICAMLATIRELRTVDIPHVQQIAGPATCSGAPRDLVVSVEFIETDDLFAAASKFRLADLSTVLFMQVDPLTPGGSYASGEPSLETDLCIRSNYTLAVDRDFRARRCKKPAANDQLTSYPICGHTLSATANNEYGGLLVQGVNVFRTDASRGFEFISVDGEDDGFELDIYGTGAYALPLQPLTGSHVGGLSQAERLYAIHTRRKIEAFLSHAAIKNNKTLFVTPFGEAETVSIVAYIFKVALQEFSGCFSKIVFAFPNGSPLLDTFKREFTAAPSIAKFPLSELQFDKFSLKVCTNGGVCETYTVEHRSTYIHPPRCGNQETCKLHDDELHMLFFAHKEPCKKGTGCLRFDDVTHCKARMHPNRCSAWSDCPNTDDAHVSELWHPPLCDEGMLCKAKKASTSGMRLTANDGILSDACRLSEASCAAVLSSWVLLPRGTRQRTLAAVQAPVQQAVPCQPRLY